MGSSPQVRGRSARVIAFPARGWLIPAGAGQISAPHERNQRGRAHPRRCGADIGFSHACKLCGLIPAGAGQMPGNSRSYRAVTAHPRRCGADIFPASRLAITWGSSPQVRGRLEHSKRRPLGGRLIPAGAGQISTTTLTPVMDSAHPRRCGADSSWTVTSSTLMGSSPQVRGR